MTILTKRRSLALDIDAPHEPIRTWKDFFLHLTTITIGLLIALMLEASVEWIHHRHLVHEARTNIREELGENTQQATKIWILLNMTKIG
jgi:hypothetical protein